jgi:hypothetical protein
MHGTKSRAPARRDPSPPDRIQEAPALTDRKSLPVKRTKAKPQEEEAPTYDADEVPPQPPPPPSRQPSEKRETPDQFWNNTIKNMREKKLTQYKFICSSAF